MTTTTTTTTTTTGPTVIEAPARWRGFGLRELWRYRSIGFVLARRNLMIRYRQTVLGVAWVILQPLTYMVVFSIFFGVVARIESFGVPFPVFYFCALWMWSPMIKVVNEGTSSLISNLQLVTRVYVPRALIPLSVAIVTVVDLVFVFVAFLVILLIYGYVPDERVLLIPVPLAVGYATVLGVAYLLSAVSARYRDIQLMLPFVVQIWFFVSPVLYPAQNVPEPMQPLYYLNPMALVVTASRWIFADIPAPPGYAWIVAPIVSALVLVGGYLFFRGREPSFADDL